MTQTRQKTEWTIKRLLEWTTDYLNQSDIEQPRLCAEMLLAHVLQCQRIDLYTRFDYLPDPEQLKTFRELVRRCADHEPAQYLIGKAHFFSLELAVTPDVLIPRPETEILVSRAIEFIRKRTVRPTVTILDLCTGSGCIAVALVVNAIEAEIIAVDRCPTSLDIAKQNVEKHDLTGRVTLREGDLFVGLDQAPIQLFDLIVSNPPYIAESDYENLPDNVRRYEPPLALKAGPDGLDYYHRILNDANSYLADDGAIMFEIGHDQADRVIALCQNCGYLKDVTSAKDGLNYERVVIAHKK